MMGTWFRQSSEHSSGKIIPVLWQNVSLAERKQFVQMDSGGRVGGKRPHFHHHKL